ncbi:Asp23/Gls24 family envelope stress response protein [Staphylococcus arlettae]|uniref:Asp23/Gls24 family envelope stress response protein n=1 Tax=Staphylococcus arlettae TaxID=29378 RepID=UPI001E5BACF1|nr:Asp23/Gls24 family envelope stress response protein [Staphylococcus arlettae]MCD8863028.1 Asp23/Gls24 family envelope stress response protein [Staphylococcus arlettae]
MVKVAGHAQSNLGNIEISTEVLAVTASIATSEIKGIHGHFKELRNANFDEITQRQLNKGIQIEIKDEDLYIDVFCAFEQGVNISETAKAIQNAIYNALTTMTAIEPKQINIHISHIACSQRK